MIEQQNRPVTELILKKVGALNKWTRNEKGKIKYSRDLSKTEKFYGANLNLFLKKLKMAKFTRE
jgi:hypothetical protein